MQFVKHTSHSAQVCPTLSEFACDTLYTKQCACTSAASVFQASALRPMVLSYSQAIMRCFTCNIDTLFKEKLWATKPAMTNVPVHTCHPHSNVYKTTHWNTVAQNGLSNSISLYAFRSESSTRTGTVCPNTQKAFTILYQSIVKNPFQNFRGIWQPSRWIGSHSLSSECIRTVNSLEWLAKLTSANQLIA